MFIKQLNLFLVCLCLSLAAQATHIVGGGFQYKWVAGSQYQFRLTLYFDDINGSPDAQDANLTCYIFRRADDAFMDALYMPRISSNAIVPYTNPMCAFGSDVRTRILVYENNIILPGGLYNHPGGYYVVWERCCRNAGIDNILLPGGSGQTFYMEFPPVQKNGLVFTNSSPVFRPMASDYLCVDDYFSLSFAADDPDGDSLVYRMTSPLRGNSTSSQPAGLPAIPAPYPSVTWAAGYTAFNAIMGEPALQVNASTGLLTCKPFFQGLFVFSVICEEYRAGQKIGEVRREMQLKVKDCIPNHPPVINSVNPITSQSFVDGDTLFVITTGAPVCQVLQFTEVELDQTIHFRVLPLSANVPAALLKDTTMDVLAASGTATYRYCLPGCLASPPTAPWKIALIATDNGCSIPKADTLILNVVARLDSISKPGTTLLGAQTDTFSVMQTELLKVDFRTTHPYRVGIAVTSVFFDAAGNPIPVAANGIQLPGGVGTQTVNTSLVWPEICFLPEHQPLRLLVVSRVTDCGPSTPDTVVKWVRIIPQTLDVQISSDYAGQNPIVLGEDQSVGFTLTGTASQNRLVQLSSTGNLTALPGYSFPPGQGNGITTAAFAFKASCAIPAGYYDAIFLASSQFCGVNHSDTIAYTLFADLKWDSLKQIPNLITANGDERNEAFAMDEILAEDNCLNHFDFVEIVNRWGNRVYHSTDRHFVWKPGRNETGVYFFALHFKEHTYRNWLMVMQ